MAEVDTSLPEQATGAAAKLAGEHAEENALKLYGGWFCPFVQRAWIVLEEKRVRYQYVEINPYRKTAEFLALNPRGLVPTLAVAGAGALYESTVICDYVDDQYGDEARHGPGLYPADAFARARCRLWIDHVGSKIVPAFYRLMQHTAAKDYSIAEARADFLAHVKTFVGEMDPAGPWFLGDRFGMVDIMLAPWALRLFLIDHYKPGGVGIPHGGADGEIWSRWAKWLDAVGRRPSVRSTWSEDESYIQAYKRYAEDTTQSEVGQATRKGLTLP